MELTIDELARTAGTSVRNVRVYQDRGLLPPPERRGRLGVYGPDHLRRLKLVLRMLDRGYPLAAIRELIEAWEDRRDIASVLGLEEAIT
ncbi:MAG TPA: MerR family transcriptional regulator, partial [Acidimicrobiia bacterium]|nr:MerR family transcriptional regulator [Acidimicrobiia bacterium]